MGHNLHHWVLQQTGSISIRENIQFVVDDSVNFIKNFHKKVDIIYLDSLDGNLPGASEHQLSETLYAIKKINSGGIIMLDDKGQKTNLSIDYLIKNGFEILFENNVQVILKNSWNIFK